MESLPVNATGLVAYHAGTRVLVIGAADRIGVAKRLADPLNSIPVTLDLNGSEGPRVDGRPLQLQGYLGKFELYLGQGDNALSLEADMVLDLSPEPLLAMAMKPPGYVAPGPGEPALTRALEELAGLTGSFDKPQYIRYDPDRCAHARNGVTACTRCIDACPAEAIQGLDEAIQVDPFLCQGGGACATVCPSGAIGYAYPTLGDLLARIRRLLMAFFEAGGRDPVLLLHAGEGPSGGLLARYPRLLPVDLEELASAGPEVWLSALAYGARRVILQWDAGQSLTLEQALRGPLQMLEEIMQGLGYPRRAVAMGALETLLEQNDCDMPQIEPARHAAMDDKRTALFMALDHLQQQAGRSRPMVNLSAGAPFGAAYVEAGACTLCMACASVCPGHALQDGQGQPQLRFIEANCIQCGLCTRTCPENAIWITPRLLLDPQARARPRILHQDEPFCCVTCGKPFATRRVIDNMLAKLTGHSMFQTERSRRRLKMCDECRVVDVVQDREMMQGETSTRQ